MLQLTVRGDEDVEADGKETGEIPPGSDSRSLHCSVLSSDAVMVLVFHFLKLLSELKPVFQLV